MPVSHIWFFGAPSRIGLMLDLTASQLERVLTTRRLVVDPGDTPLNYSAPARAEYAEAVEKYGENFQAMMGAEAIRKCLSRSTSTR